MAKIRRIFPGGNTSHGFYSLHDNMMGFDRNMLYIVKGVPGGGKSSLMREIGRRAAEKGYSLEYHHCPSDPNSIDGIVIVELGIGIIDGTPPHGIDPTFPGIKDKIVDLGRFVDEEKLKDKEEDIVLAKKNNKYAYSKAFSYLKAAKTIYELIEVENKRYIDQKGINTKGKDLIDKVFSNKEVEVKINGFDERHLFSTAYTPEGFIDYTSTILEHVSHVYYIEGEIGTGKSLLLKRILEESRIRNYSVEIYYNSLLPDKIESIFIKNLDTIVTSNENGGHFAKFTLNLNDYIDISKVNSEDYSTFNFLIEKGINSLGGAKENHFILEKSYRPAIDYDEINKVKEEIYNEIVTYMK